MTPASPHQCPYISQYNEDGAISEIERQVVGFDDGNARTGETTTARSSASLRSTTMATCGRER